MDGFLELFEELTKVSREALKCDTCIPRRGDVEDIGFCFGPPNKGRIAFYIIRDGRKYMLGKLCDCYPFIPTLRGWMERAITPTLIGRRRNEGITIECDDGVIELTLSPTNLESSTAMTNSGGYCVVGILKVKHVNTHADTYECFCNVEQTVYNLYSALQHTFKKHGSAFNDRVDWTLFDRDMPFRIDKSTSQLLQEQLWSEKIELLGRHRHE